MNTILIFASIIIFFIGLFYLLLCIFKIKNYKTEKITNLNIRKLYKTESLYSKIRNKVNSYLERKKILPEIYISNMTNKLELCKLNKTPYEYIFDSFFVSILLLIFSIPIYFINPLIGSLLSILIVLYGIMKYRVVDKKFKKIKDDIESHLCDFNRYILRKINETNDVFLIISSYLNYTSGNLRQELEKTLSDMKTNSPVLALAKLDRRINSQMLSDIISGLNRLYAGEDNKEYFILNEMKLTLYEESRLDNKAKSHAKTVKLVSIISLIMFIMTYAILMINLLSTSITLIF